MTKLAVVHFFTSLNDVAWALGAPPVGAKVTSAVTLAFPFLRSFLRALPFAFTNSVTSPAAAALALAPLTLAVSASSRPPAPGTSTASRAVPFFLLRVRAPNVNSFGTGAMRGAGATWIVAVAVGDVAPAFEAAKRKLSVPEKPRSGV